MMAANSFKVPIYPMSSERFGPLIRQASNFRKDWVSDAAAEVIENDPTVLAYTLLNRGLLHNTIFHQQQDSPIAVLEGEWPKKIFVLREEYKHYYALSTYKADSRIHQPRAAVLCIAEITKCHLTQNLSEYAIPDKKTYSYSDPIEKCQPYQRIYGANKFGRFYAFLNMLADKLPDIFLHSFADLGGGFGWPTFLWAQFTRPGTKTVLFESRKELAGLASVSKQYLTSFGLQLDSTEIFCDDFLRADLTTYKVLYAYRPFLVVPDDPEENQKSCYQIIFERLEEIDWRGKYFIGFASNYLEELAQKHHYTLLFECFGQKVYKNIRSDY